MVFAGAAPKPPNPVVGAAAAGGAVVFAGAPPKPPNPVVGAAAAGGAVVFAGAPKLPNPGEVAAAGAVVFAGAPKLPKPPAAGAAVVLAGAATNPPKPLLGAADDVAAPAPKLPKPPPTDEEGAVVLAGAAPKPPPLPKPPKLPKPEAAGALVVVVAAVVDAPNREPEGAAAAEPKLPKPVPGAALLPPPTGVMVRLLPVPKLPKAGGEVAAAAGVLLLLSPKLSVPPTHAKGSCYKAVVLWCRFGIWNILIRCIRIRKKTFLLKAIILVWSCVLKMSYLSL